MEETKTDRLLTAKEVAARFGITDPRTVGRLAKQKKIPLPVEGHFGKGDRWRESEIAEHIRKLKNKAYEAA